MPSYTANRDAETIDALICAELEKGDADTLEIAERVGCMNWEAGTRLYALAKRGVIARAGFAARRAGRTRPPRVWTIKQTAQGETNG